MPEVEHMPVEQAPPAYKLDVELHELLIKPAARPPAPPPPVGRPQTLPVPPFPSRPRLQRGSDEEYIPKDGNLCSDVTNKIVHTGCWRWMVEGSAA